MNTVIDCASHLLIILSVVRYLSFAHRRLVRFCVFGFLSNHSSAIFKKLACRGALADALLLEGLKMVGVVAVFAQQIFAQLRQYLKDQHYNGAKIHFE